MTAPNHIAGGFTFTGIFASILGINILADYRLIPIIIFAALLPDIDHPKSIIGRMFLPISKSINRRFGHRTITHSLIVWILLTALISAFQAAYFPTIKVAQIFCLAYGSHLLFDMVTQQGIPLFYPFKKNACVLPGRSELRLRSGNIRHEAICLCIFIVSGVFMKPLFADGFWTSYNRLFGTMAHVKSEFNKSDDLLRIDFTVQNGSDQSAASGICIAIDNSSMVLLDEQDDFQQYPQKGQILKDLYPIHTGRKFGFEQGEFADIGIDSMRILFAESKYTELKMFGSKKFSYLNNGIATNKKNLSLKYPNELIISEINDYNPVFYETSPDIAAKESEINLYRTKYKSDLASYRQQLQSYDQAAQAMDEERDPVKKEIMMIQFNQMKAPTPPNAIEDKIKRLETEIIKIKAVDSKKHQKALREAETKPLSFSGSYQKLKIYD